MNNVTSFTYYTNSSSLLSKLSSSTRKSKIPIKIESEQGSWVWQFKPFKCSSQPESNNYSRCQGRKAVAGNAESNVQNQLGNNGRCLRLNPAFRFKELVHLLLTVLLLVLRELILNKTRYNIWSR